jgi:hypothetical protein
VAKYGRESVAQIITFGKMFPRAATRDAARVLGHDYGAGDRLAKLIPDPEQGRAPTFERCLQPGEPLRGAYDTDATAKQIVDVARGLEGIVRNASIHAAAVVIAGMPLTDVVPLQLADSGGGGNGNGNGNGNGRGAASTPGRRPAAPSPSAFAHLPPGRPAAARANKPGEIVVHYDEGSEPGGLQIGTKLCHPQFGVGEVRGWQAAGADMKVTMRFPKAGVKTILARFLTKP